MANEDVWKHIWKHDLANHISNYTDLSVFTCVLKEAMGHSYYYRY